MGIDDTRNDHREQLKKHLEWVAELGSWRSDYQRTLAVLARLEARVHERLADLEAHAETIRLHDAHLHHLEHHLSDAARDGSAEQAPAEPESGARKLKERHAEIGSNHERMREGHLAAMGQGTRFLNLLLSIL